MTIPATHAEIEQIYLQSEQRVTDRFAWWAVNLKKALRLSPLLLPSALSWQVTAHYMWT